MPWLTPSPTVTTGNFARAGRSRRRIDRWGEKEDRTEHGKDCSRRLDPSGLGQTVGLAGGGQGIAAVLLADLPGVGMVADPRKLVGQDRAEQLAVAVRFLDSLAPVQLEHLINIE